MGLGHAFRFGLEGVTFGFLECRFVDGAEDGNCLFCVLCVYFEVSVVFSAFFGDVVDLIIWSVNRGTGVRVRINRG